MLDLQVIRNGDRLTVSGLVKNSGTEPVSRIAIHDLVVSDLRMTQDPLYNVIVTGNDRAGSEVSTELCGTILIYNACPKKLYWAEGFSIRQIGGDPLISNSALAAGETGKFELYLEIGEWTLVREPDILNNVRLFDDLSLVLKVESGQDVRYTETFTAQVRPP